VFGDVPAFVKHSSLRPNLLYLLAQAVVKGLIYSKKVVAALRLPFKGNQSVVLIIRIGIAM